MVALYSVAYGESVDTWMRARPKVFDGELLVSSRAPGLPDVPLLIIVRLISIPRAKLTIPARFNAYPGLVCRV